MARKSALVVDRLEILPTNWHHTSVRGDGEAIIDNPARYGLCGAYQQLADNSDKAALFWLPDFLIPKKMGSHRVASYASFECIYERVWVDPQIVYAGFILRDIEDEIIIWNAFTDQEAGITAISATGENGTDLDYTVPATLAPLGAAVWDLTIFVSGPPTQDAYYYPTVDGVQYSIHVYGVRLLVIVPEPNWIAPPKIKYSFSTVVSSNPYFREQRRPLFPSPERAVSASYLVENLESQILFNAMSYGHDKVIAVPVYDEQMFSSDLTVGNTQITLTQSTEYLWNLHNLCEYIVLIDHISGVSEVIEVSTIPDNTTITFVGQISAVFDENSTVIYPAVISLIKALKFTSQTDLADVVDIDFVEYISGGQ